VRSAPRNSPKTVVAVVEAVEQARRIAMEEAALRITPRLAVAVVIAGLLGIGWVARSTLAQNSPQKSVSTPAPVLPPPAPAPAVSPRLPFDLDLATGVTSPGGTDDPEKTAQAFVEQNRQVAEAQLKNLKDQAENLRSRLQKIEAGIRRWEELVAALQKSEAAASPRAAADRGSGEIREPGEPQFKRRRQLNARPVSPTDPVDVPVPPTGRAVSPTVPVAPPDPVDVPAPTPPDSGTVPGRDQPPPAREVEPAPPSPQPAPR